MFCRFCSLNTVSLCATAFLCALIKYIPVFFKSYFIFPITKGSVNALMKLAGFSTSNTSTDLEGRKEMFYLTTHSTHFIYGYMALDIW